MGYRQTPDLACQLPIRSLIGLNLHDTTIEIAGYYMKKYVGIIELKKDIEKSKSLSGKIKKIESADKMSMKQIAAKVRTFFKTHL